MNMAVDGEIYKNRPPMKNRDGTDVPARLRLPNSLRCPTMMHWLFQSRPSTALWSYGKQLNEIGMIFGVINHSIFCAGTRRMTNQKDH
jgi:hypothetical protein